MPTSRTKRLLLSAAAALGVAAGAAGLAGAATGGQVAPTQAAATAEADDAQDQERRRPARGPPPAVLVSQLAPVGLGVDRLTPELDRPLQRATGHRVGAYRHSDLPHARSPLAQRPCPSRSCHPAKVGTEVGTYRRALQRQTARILPVTCRNGSARSAGFEPTTF